MQLVVVPELDMVPTGTLGFESDFHLIDLKQKSLINLVDCSLLSTDVIDLLCYCVERNYLIRYCWMILICVLTFKLFNFT